MVIFRVLSETNSRLLFLAAPSKSQVLNSLPALEILLPLFFRFPSLFSIACGLFLQNTGGEVPPRHPASSAACAIALLSIFNSCLFISLQIPFSVTYLFSDSSALPGGGGIPLPISQSKGLNRDAHRGGIENSSYNEIGGRAG